MPIIKLTLSNKVYLCIIKLNGNSFIFQIGKMMEESSDESAEIISNEEADLARKMQEATEFTGK